MLQPRKMKYDKAGPKVAENLRKRHFDAYYFSTKEEAAAKVMELIDAGDTVSWGGSMTVDELGIKDLLRQRGQKLIDRDSAKTSEERMELMRRGLTADTFLTGSNAITESGELYNIDGNGNRVAAMIFGPKSVIVVAGMNKVVSDLKVYGTVQRAVLGVMGTDVTNYIDSEKAKGNEVDLGEVEGVYITKVSDASAAQEAGLKKGDVVTKFDGKKVTKMSELQEAISQHSPGDKVSLTYSRDKKAYTVNVTMRNSQGTTKVLEEVDMDQLGVSLKPASDEVKRAIGLDYGLEVSAVRQGGKMKAAGASKGTIILQVNDKKVATVEDWESAVEEASRSTDRTLWIKAMTPSGRKVSLVVDLND